MKAFWTVKRVGRVLWARMYTDCQGDYYAANCPVSNRKEALVQFNLFVEELRGMLR